MKFPWQSIHPIDAILFDCDGTLSRIEGIDELAKYHQVTDIVQRLTRDAMGNSGMNPTIYAERLRLTQPTQTEVETLGEKYFTEMTPDVREIIAILQRLQKAVFIVSAGLFPSVLTFANHLKIPKNNVFAVNVTFDKNGQYQDFDHESPMVYKNGKQKIVALIKKQYPHIAFVGDGLSDYDVYSDVTRFIGYGGAFYRENIAKHCEFYIKESRMGALLPLVLTENEYHTLTDNEKNLYQTGIEAIQQHKVEIQLHKG
ncbi:MAG TPA: HAD-IB family phosphatase [Gammaproteobacteria bacterium]|nr:HAD-IB family phosphatase [Gammaproteobacteria bacterium]